MSDRLDIYFHFGEGPSASPGPVQPNAQLDRIEGMLTIMAKEIDDLRASVGKLVTDIDSTIALAQSASTALHTALDAALKTAADAVANDTADAATIADLQAQLVEIKAAAVDVTNSLQAADQKVTDAGANLTPAVVLPPVPDPLPVPDAPPV